MGQLVSAKVVDTARGPIEYAVRGTGKPVLVIHGSPGGIDAAEGMARFLPEDRFRSILLSRPGYLGTELAGRLTSDDQADLYAALLDELEIERVGVLAWSGGGPSAFRFVAAHPDRATSLVAIACLSGRWVNPTPDFSTRLLQTTRFGDWLMKKLVARQPSKVIEGVISSESSLSGTEFDDHVKYIESDETARRFVLDMALTASQTGAHKPGWDNDCVQFGKIESLGLETVRVPTLIVQGSADSDVEPEHSVRAHELIPDSQLFTLDRGTHLAFYVHPNSAAVQAEAIEYLSRP